MAENDVEQARREEEAARERLLEAEIEAKDTLEKAEELEKDAPPPRDPDEKP